jgi:hypothetical protein
MATFNNPKDLIAHLEKAAAEQLKETIVTSQAWLGNSNNVPFDTGRMLSSWFSAEGSPSSQVAPEGANSPQTDAKGLEVRIGPSYHLTNNLPYAAPIALGIQLPPSWGGKNRTNSAPYSWFVAFRNREIPQLMQAAGRVIKRRFDL